VDIIDADGFPCNLGDEVFDDDGNVFDICEILIRVNYPISIRSKDCKYVVDIDHIHHVDQGMRIYFIDKDSYLSLSEADQESFTNAVQEAYDKIADEFLNPDSEEPEEAEPVSKKLINEYIYEDFPKPKFKSSSAKEPVDKNSRNNKILADLRSGLSQKMVAKKYGVSQPTVSHIFRKATHVDL